MSANEAQRRTQRRHGAHWSAFLLVLVLLLSLTACFAKKPAVSVLDTSCQEPTRSQKESVALLLYLATDRDPNGEATRYGVLDVMPPGSARADVPELYGAAEVVSRWWGLCWPEGFDG